MKVLISGASIAGPVLAYWLSRNEFDVTVVERAPALRKTGGHAVDLFRPAMEISERMGVLGHIEARATGTTALTLNRPPRTRWTHIDYVKLIAAMSDRHVEIMRDDLSQAYYDAVRDDAEFRFGDQITSITDAGEVTFAHGAPERYDLVIGADGLHSGVRQLAFGDQAREVFLGGYLAVVSVPKMLAPKGEMSGYLAPRKIAMVYSADHLEDARAVFMFRTDEPLDYHYRDIPAQKRHLQTAFAGVTPEVDHWLREVDHTPAFYFDALTQLEMSTWSRGRITLVGDAGYCPGPGVGGSTSLAVYGAYVLAHALAASRGDHAAAFAAYERTMAAPVAGSRTMARVNAKSIVPGSDWGARALLGAGRAISLLPRGLTGRLARLNAKGVRLYDTMPLPD
jgi:2-polyprenyl-6-methoxyphenol hydroxylase-like FAD-dependent oxidoreductase